MNDFLLTYERVTCPCPIRWMICEEGRPLLSPCLGGRKGCRFFFYLLCKEIYKKSIKNYCSLDVRRRFRLIPRGLSESRSIRLSVKGNLWLRVKGN